MRTQAPGRTTHSQTSAVARAAPKGDRCAAFRSNSSSSSSRNVWLASTRRQGVVDFAKAWLPRLQNERLKLNSSAGQLATIKQALVLPSLVLPAAVNNNIKLTAANTRMRYHKQQQQQDRLDYSSARLGLEATAIVPCAVLDSSCGVAAAVHHSAIADSEEVALQETLQQTDALRAEVDELLGSCMQELAALMDVAASRNKPQSAAQASSNIVPWAAAAAATPRGLAPKSAAMLAPAAAPTNSVSAAGSQAAGDAHAIVSGDGASSIELVSQAAAGASQPQQPSSSSSSSAAADTGAVSSALQAEQMESHLVVVYLTAATSHNSSSSSIVRYLRLPEQQEEYDAAVQQGLTVVRLQGALGDRGLCGSVSAEELAWMSQEAGCWAHHQPAAGDHQQGQQQLEFFTAEVPAAPPSAAAAARQAAEEELEQQQGTQVATNDNSSGDEADQSSTVKVEVGVVIRTRPGQRVLLVGSHPTLGGWDLSKAWKLKWSDGHIWRGCLELPADIRALEFKAVLKSAEAIIWERGSNRKVKLQGAETLAVQYAFQA